jgi:hypothetical protein
MPGTKKLWPFVIQATLVAVGCVAAYFLAGYAQSPVTFIYAMLLPCYWLVLLGIAVHRFRWRGLWVLLGAPLALGWPYQILHHLVRCYHRFCID